MKRRKARELALQILFAAEAQAAESKADAAEKSALTALAEKSEKWIALYVSSFAEKLDPSHLDEPYLRALVRGTLAEVSAIDQLVEGHSDHWKLSRMTRIDRNILRLGCFELKFREDTPASVAIDEAVELAKKFGTEDSASFINGVLDQVRTSLKRESK